MSTKDKISPVFKQQLRQLAPEWEAADRLARLRHFVADSLPGGKADEQERLMKASDIIAKWKAAGIPQTHFDNMQSGAFGPTLLQHWAGQLSALRSKAAKSAKAAKQADPSVVAKPAKTVSNHKVKRKSKGGKKGIDSVK